MSPAIPDRWLNYKPFGCRIEGTRFVAFKVPLRTKVVQAVDENKRLDDVSLLKCIPNLGIIIDLTNTNRYYNPDVFRREGVEHKKLMIPGHHTPSDDLVNKFKLYVMSFLNCNKDNDKLIGVHCTHGVNRTGYLICNYMISELDIKPIEAIQRFVLARGHEIERKNYMNALYDLSTTKETTSTDCEIPRLRTQPRRDDKNEPSRSWRSAKHPDRANSYEYQKRNEMRTRQTDDCDKPRNWRSAPHRDSERYCEPIRHDRYIPSSSSRRHNLKRTLERHESQTID